jgi:hypothetical protein
LLASLFSKKRLEATKSPERQNLPAVQGCFLWMVDKISSVKISSVKIMGENFHAIALDSEQVSEQVSEQD